MWRKERCNVLFFFCGVKVFAALSVCGGFGRLCRFAGKGDRGLAECQRRGGGPPMAGWMDTVLWYDMVGLRVTVCLSDCPSLARWPTGIDRSKSGILRLPLRQGSASYFPSLEIRADGGFRCIQCLTLITHTRKFDKPGTGSIGF